VPASGPIDRIAFSLANAVVGNPHDASAVEMLLQGPTFKVLAESVRIATVGGTAAIEVRTGAVRRIAAGQSVRLERHDVFRVGAFGDSLCAYLAVEGGFNVPCVLGSASTYVRGAIGGVDGRRFVPGDRVPLTKDAVDARPERTLAGAIDTGLDQPIRVVMGPQDDYFTGGAIETFLASTYTISPQADRMGYRLEGPALAHAKGYNIVSDGIVTGSVQVPGSGQPIVLMVDNQTTGGYPKIATVISADIPVLGRRKPGRPIRFVAVDVHEAARLRREQEAWLQREIGLIRSFDGESP
jgi:allophanate hydrolase